MLLQKERERLARQQLLKTDIARKLYGKYYYTLFEFAKDLPNSNVKEIIIRDDSVILITRKENIQLNCPEGETTAALGQLILAGTENEEQEIMHKLLEKLIAQKDNDATKVTFFDIGANIGWYTIIFNKLFPELAIHAFEPIQTTFEQMLANLALNNCGEINVNNFGLADQNRQAEFYVSPSLLAASSLADTFKTDDKIKIPGEIRRLDDYCVGTRVSPDFIKCDVEGAEMLVFKGAQKILEECKPLVMCELLRKWAKCFGYHPNEVIAFFTDKQYSCFVINQGKFIPVGKVTEDTQETNFFFLHQAKHQFLV